MNQCQMRMIEMREATAVQVPLEVHAEADDANSENVLRDMLEMPVAGLCHGCCPKHARLIDL